MAVPVGPVAAAGPAVSDLDPKRPVAPGGAAHGGAGGNGRNSGR